MEKNRPLYPNTYAWLLEPMLNQDIAERSLKERKEEELGIGIGLSGASMGYILSVFPSLSALS